MRQIFTEAFLAFFILATCNFAEPAKKKAVKNAKAGGNKNPSKFKNGPGTAILDPSKKWPNGVIPYEMHPSFQKQYIPLLQQAFNHIEGRTCLRYKPNKAAKDRLVVKDCGDDACGCKIGRIGGPQDIKLGHKCNILKKFMHEMLHGAGFAHEQGRQDRDQYVKVLINNIQEEYKFAFQQQDPKDFGGFGTPYDYKSIMHYGRNGFSKNGKDTLVPTKNPKANIGSVNKMSRYDIEDVNNLYCKSVRSAAFSNPKFGFLNINGKQAEVGKQVITTPKLNGDTAKWTFEGALFFGKKGSEIWNWAQVGEGVKVVTENLANHNVIMAVSVENQQNQLWLGVKVMVGKQTMFLVKNAKTGRCLQASAGNNQLKTVKCTVKQIPQRWKLSSVVP